MIKKYFKNWNLYEKLYLTIGIISTIIVTLITKSSIISMLYVITYITNALLSSKGKPECYIFGFTGIIFYGYLSYQQKYFGELIIILFMSIPVMIMGVISWLKNKDDESIIINTLSKKEIILVILSQVIMFFLYYYILKLFNTSMLVTSTLSIIMSLLALYFGSRRSEICYYFYILNDIVGIALWIMPILNGEKAMFSVIFGPILLFVNDIYGIYNWKKLKKKQREVK
ncbi:MAG: nicotinamide mononucleotide transporter [Bacilli bacterium]|nr:nicotinamide mononucleotide transporter [Bacilli bacterium]